MPLEDTPSLLEQAAQGLAWMLGQAAGQSIPIAFGYMLFTIILMASIIFLVEFIKLYLIYATAISALIFTLSIIAYIKII